MGNKIQILKPLPCTIPLFLISISFCIFCASSSIVAQRDREWSLWSVHHMLTLPLLRPQREKSSCSFTWSAMGSLPQEHGAPEWVPSMVFSPLGTGCFSVGAPCSHTPWPETCFSMDSLLHQCTGPARHPIQDRLPTDHSCLCEAVPSLAASLWTLMDLTMVFTMSCMEPQLLEHLLLLLRHQPYICLADYLIYSHSFSGCSFSGIWFLSPVLNTLSWRCYSHCWWVCPWPGAGASCTQLALTQLNVGEAPDSFS